MKFPHQNDTVDCPNCGGKSCSFDQPGSSPNVRWEVLKRFSGLDAHIDHTLDVVYCRSCGQPIRLMRRVVRGRPVLVAANKTVSDQLPEDCVRILFPVAQTRDLAHEAVRHADADLARDYDEAVACEPHSLQAAAMLLGRCASTILIAMCDADGTKTLGVQYDAAVQAKKLPDNAAGQFEGLLQCRNRAAHPWFNSTGGHLTVEQDDVDWCFEIIGLMFDHFYVNPAKLEKRRERMEAAKAEKQK